MEIVVITIGIMVMVIIKKTIAMVTIKKIIAVVVAAVFVKIISKTLAILNGILITAVVVIIKTIIALKMVCGIAIVNIANEKRLSVEILTTFLISILKSILIKLQN